jgi:hypothetical protein
MENEQLDIDSLSASDYQQLQYLRRVVQLPILEYERLSNFPPFSLSANQEIRQEFMDMAWKAFNEGNEVLRYEIPDNFQPYAELKKRFGRQMRDAQNYMEKSNGNSAAAVKLFSSDNPDVKIEESDFY